MINKISDKEKVFRLLEELGDWEWGYNLRSRSTKDGFIGSEGDTRAHDLVRENRIERRLVSGKAQFRAKSRITLPPAFLPRKAEPVSLFS